MYLWKGLKTVCRACCHKVYTGRWPNKVWY